MSEERMTGVPWTEEDMMARAFRAYYRGYKGRENLLDTPANYSCVQEHNGRDYAVLRNGNGVLALWRIDRDGGLHRLDPDGRLARALEEL
jgi:hypothetical protein